MSCSRRFDGNGIADIGNPSLLAFFDFPGLDLTPYAEVLRGLHHVAMSMEPSRWQEIVQRIDEAGIEYVTHNDVCVYFTDPDSARTELIADPLGEMYGPKGDSNTSSIRVHCGGAQGQQSRIRAA